MISKYIKPIYSLILPAIFGLAFFSMPSQALAIDTTYYIPMQGYYFGQNGLPTGMQWVCANGNCAPSNYPTTSGADPYPYVSYIPYTRQTIQEPTITNYPYPTYTPYVKVDNSYQLGTARQIGYYPFSSDGKLVNAQNSPYITYPAGQGSYYANNANGFTPTTSAVSYGNQSGAFQGQVQYQGGFIFTGN